MLKIILYILLALLLIALVGGTGYTLGYDHGSADATEFVNEFWTGLLRTDKSV